jgi:hypothetical protein
MSHYDNLGQHYVCLANPFQLEYHKMDLLFRTKKVKSLWFLKNQSNSLTEGFCAAINRFSYTNYTSSIIIIIISFIEFYFLNTKYLCLDFLKI